VLLSRQWITMTRMAGSGAVRREIPTGPIGWGGVRHRLPAGMGAPAASYTPIRSRKYGNILRHHGQSWLTSWPQKSTQAGIDFSRNQ
jgi:hypothetical protein